MAKWIFTRPDGPWQYPTLGFTAIAGDVIENAAAIDPWWEPTDPGAAVTIPATPGGGVIEPAGGSVLTYDRAQNGGIWTPSEDLGILSEEQLENKIVHLAVGVRTSDGHSLPAGTMVVLTIDKTLAQVTASPVADIADITFEEA